MPPSAWRAVKDQTPGSDDYYFWNQLTDETSWDLPVGFVHVDGQPYLQPLAPPPAYESPASRVAPAPPAQAAKQEGASSLLQCPSCHSSFAVGENPLRPRLLGCGHSLCQEEVDKLTSSGTVRCPVCQLSSPIPFSPNFALEELITSLTELGIPANGKCAECDSPAALFCVSCKAQLCPEHDKTIHSFKSSASHQRTNIVNDPAFNDQNTVRMCLVHPEERLKIFCITCQTPICRDCKDFAPAHAGHSTSLVSHVVAANRTLLEQEAAKLKYISQLYLPALAQCLEVELQLDTLATTMKATLERDYNAMLEGLKRRKAVLEDEIAQFATDNKAILRRHRQDVLFAYSNVSVTQEECVRVASLSGADLLGQLRGTLSHSIAAASQHPQGMPPSVVPASLRLEATDTSASWGRLNCVSAQIETKRESPIKEAAPSPSMATSTTATATATTTAAAAAAATATTSSNTVLSSTGFPVPKRPVNLNKTPTLRPFTVSTPTPPQPLRLSPSTSAPSAAAPSSPVAVTPTPAPPLRPGWRDPKLRALAATTDPNILSLGPQLEYLRKGSTQYE